jgi:hypothetical protein
LQKGIQYAQSRISIRVITCLIVPSSFNAGTTTVTINNQFVFINL